MFKQAFIDMFKQVWYKLINNLFKQDETAKAKVIRRN